MVGKFIFVSGLSGAGKTTLVRAILAGIDSVETVVTYVTRPQREGEEDAPEYIFVDDTEYESLKATAKNWDETIYAGYKYGADGAKYFQDLRNGISVIVAVAPDLTIIQTMAQKYEVQPITIWVDTDEALASARIKNDTERASRKETAKIKQQFDTIFHPTGDIVTDQNAFLKLVTNIIKDDENA